MSMLACGVAWGWSISLDRHGSVELELRDGYIMKVMILQLNRGEAQLWKGV